MEFVHRLNAGEKMTDLCRAYGISRKTGYKFLERFKKCGPAGLFDGSRRPVRLANRAPVALKELFLEARRAHPTWGPKKLRVVLETQHPGVLLPAASTVGDWLKEAGLVKKRKRTLRVSPYESDLKEALAPNDTWCVDYKGQFQLGNGKLCYPLTVTDHFSRYLLSCEGFERIDGLCARDVFEQLFSTHGLPKVIRSDNGSPFAARGLFGLTKLAVFWLKAGVLPERIEPAHPEQNGRHERMHRTLKEEATRPAGSNLLQQQERFDAFVQEYNEIRPHEALGQRTPASVYQSSSRKFTGTTALSYPLHDRALKVAPSGHLQILRQRNGSFFLSSALGGEQVGVREMPDGELLVSFARLDLGYFNPATKRFRPCDSTVHSDSTPFESPLELPSNNPTTTTVLPMSPV